VQHAPTVYVIFWGGNWASGGGLLTPAASQLIYLYGALPKSDYQAILTQYGDAIGPIGMNAAVGGWAVDNTAPAPSGVKGSTFEAAAAAMIAAKSWPVTADSQFVVAVAPGATYDSSFAQGACAFHQNVIQSRQASLTFVPSMTDAPFNDCAGLYGNGDSVHAMTTVASHEYAESATDPFLDAWKTAASAGGDEVGDLCAPSAGVPDRGGNYEQKEWSNRDNGCVSGSPKIMVVGDSISQGLDGDFTWRYRLSNHLLNGGANFVNVGPRTGTHDLYSGTEQGGGYRVSGWNWGVSRILDRFSVVDQAAAAAVRYSLRASCGVR